jgi:hypothetical protein
MVYFITRVDSDCFQVEIKFSEYRSRHRIEPSTRVVNDIFYHTVVIVLIDELNNIGLNTILVGAQLFSALQRIQCLLAWSIYWNS